MDTIKLIELILRNGGSIQCARKIKDSPEYFAVKLGKHSATDPSLEVALRELEKNAEIK